jgi:hypothetical protein
MESVHAGMVLYNLRSHFGSHKKEDAWRELKYFECQPSTPGNKQNR